MQPATSARNWALFLALSAMWASAFAFTKVAVDGLPASVIIPARVSIGAAILLVAMLARGERFPPFSHRAAWLTMIGIGTVGTAAPFYLITLGQKTIDSSLAALLISGAPLFVAGMAHLRFADERLTPLKIVGILVGFVGVAVLLGPDALKGLGNADLIAQLLVLGGAFCYAINSIIARGAPPISPIVLPAGFLLIASLSSLPMLALTDWSQVTPRTDDILAVVALGAVPTGLAGITLMVLVRETSATFIALTGYVIPIISAVIGYIAFGETQSWNALAAFALILGGVWIAQRAQRQAARQAARRADAA